VLLVEGIIIIIIIILGLTKEENPLQEETNVGQGETTQGQ
jgi:hypothetical protein